MELTYPLFISSTDRVSGAHSSSYTVNVNADRILKDTADFFEVSLVRFFACSYSVGTANQISSENTNFYQIQLSLAQPFNICTGTSILKNPAFLVPTVSCNNVPATIYSGREQSIVVSKASLANLLSVTILNDLGKTIDTNVDIAPVQYSEHVIQLSFKPLR